MLQRWMPKLLVQARVQANKLRRSTVNKNQSAVLLLYDVELTKEPTNYGSCCGDGN